MSPPRDGGSPRDTEPSSDGDPLSDGGLPRDDGPPERTAMSWQRSELAVALVGAFVVVAALRLEVVWVAVAAGVFALAGVTVAVAGRPREPRRDEHVPWPWLPRIALATAVVGLLGAVLGVGEILGRAG